MPTDLNEYERLGDLKAPFTLSAKDERKQLSVQRMRDSRCELAPLTFEQYSAGAPCPGCGRPYMDAERFEFRGR